MEPRTAHEVQRTGAAAGPSPRSVAAADPVPGLLAEDIAEAVHDLEDGRSTRARRRLGALWALVPTGSAHRSAVAHWLAVAGSTGPVAGVGGGAAVRWHEEALNAAEDAADWSAPFTGTALTLREMYPELHIDLARAYQEAGEACGTLEHLALARNALDVTARGERRRRLERMVAQIDAALGTRGGAGPEDWGWEREDDLDDFWDDEGTG